MPMLEGKVDAVIGVDTHRDSHTAAILDRNGGLIAELEVPSNQAGYEQLLDSVAQRAPRCRCWALEGTGCYGAGLASFLLDRGEWVTEIDRPKRTGRTQAKSDPLDAIRAGREALSREHLACPRQRGQREALRVLQLTRAGAVKVSADARRHLKALLVTAPSRCGPGCGAGPGCGKPTRARRSPRRHRIQWSTGPRCRRCGPRPSGPWPPTTRPPSSARSWARWPGRWCQCCWPSAASARSPAPRC